MYHPFEMKTEETIFDNLNSNSSSSSSNDDNTDDVSQL